MMQQGQLQADLYLFSSTSILFRYHEMQAYIKALSNSAKAVVINEAWWACDKPEDISVDKLKIAGPYSTYHYNYPELFKQAGFEIKCSQFIECQDMTIYQFIAYNTRGCQNND
jgi:hypothetical protein